MSIGGKVLIQGTVVVLLLLLLPLFAPASTTALAQPPPESLPGLGCSNEVASFSPCLDYVSSSSDNRSAQPSLQCCGLFSSVYQRHEAACLCYLARRPLISSFRINTTRLYSLSSLCSHQKNNVGSDAKIPLESICLGTRSRSRSRGRSHRHSPHSPTTENPTEGTSDAPSVSSVPITEAHKSSAMEKHVTTLGSLVLLGEFLIPLAAVTLIMNR